MTNHNKNGKELIITRIFDAPRDLVWKAWTDAEHMNRWWGPKNFTAPVCKIGFREEDVAKTLKVSRESMKLTREATRTR